MKTDFLKSIGIEDQEVINKIMAENGKDVNKAKGDFENVSQQLTDLKTQLEDRDKQLTELQKVVKGNEDFEKQISELQNQNKQAKEEYEKKISDMKINSAIELALRDANAKNITAVKPFLNMENIKLDNDKLSGLNEQIEALQKGETTSFLFGEKSQSTPPAGTKPANSVGNNPQTTSDNLLRNALEKRFNQ